MLKPKIKSKKANKMNIKELETNLLKEINKKEFKDKDYKDNYKNAWKYDYKHIIKWIKKTQEKYPEVFNNNQLYNCFEEKHNLTNWEDWTKRHVILERGRFEKLIIYNLEESIKNIIYKYSEKILKKRLTTKKIEYINNEKQFKKYVINDFLKTININDLMAFNELKNVNDFWEQYEEKVFDIYYYSSSKNDLLNILPYVFNECKEYNKKYGEKYGLNIFDNIVNINGAIYIYIKKHLKIKKLIEMAGE